MISFDRETLTIVAVILCIAATVYMYREFTQAKSDIEGIKGFCNKIVQAHTPPPTQQRVIQEHDDEEEEEVPINNVAESKEN
tara:strand:+ start:1211 stop:1456 length:246 start_codon:yes stop_codon:yes gene_type:complete